MEKNSRLAFIDLHRGLVLLVMIEVHVFNAFLMQSYRPTLWFMGLNFINGLVAPSFLFISGFAFILASQKKMKEFRTLGWQFYRQVGRILLILLAGYSLHVPFFSLSRTMEKSNPEQWQHFFAVDVLQCIAVSLLLLFLLRLMITHERVFKYVTGFFALFFVLPAPYMWAADFSGMMHPALAAYLNKMSGSLFPLFPWSGFLFMGAFLSIIFSEFRKRGEVDKYFSVLKYTALVFIALGSVLYIEQSPLHFPMMKPEITFFFLRAGYIFLIFYGCYLFAKRSEGSWVKIISGFGRESLLVYWLHLQVIYRKVGGISLNGTYKYTFGVIESVAATIVLAALMWCAAWLWSYLKQKFPRAVQFGTPAVVALLILFFIST